MVVLCLLCIAIIGLIVYWAQSTQSHTYQSYSDDSKNIESVTTKGPTESPTVIPSETTTPAPIGPTTDPTFQPTMSPVSMILQIGNTID
eukprot:CAMPEP_0202713776 /NCGR_PEP_ID=MMETSP1385-20130828/59364_1 /ASSEMBLY_ACC=CAM_ASM_000861 /TAXON_ID=933848 /ORGANISM="Elphidium margaritaceum" /LENGTH=88 /DNA_ID=CAMNT_0049374247 /DNA_START=1 /DNA_END=264 /DNA_ORIENTATION=-